jgi:hypothetical protein
VQTQATQQAQFQATQAQFQATQSQYQATQAQQQAALRTELLAAVKDKSVQPSNAKELVKAVVKHVDEVIALGVTHQNV